MTTELHVGTYLLTDKMLYAVFPELVRVLRIGRQQVDADLFTGDDCAREVVDAVRDAADELVWALVRREARRQRAPASSSPESVPEFLRKLDAGALSLRGP